MTVRASLDALAREAAAAGAVALWANVLFLKPCAYQVFLPFLEERFPELVRKYRERYERAAYLRGAYPEMIQERVERDPKTPRPGSQVRCARSRNCGRTILRLRLFER